MFALAVERCLLDGLLSDQTNRKNLLGDWANTLNPADPTLDAITLDPVGLFIPILTSKTK